MSTDTPAEYQPPTIEPIERPQPPPELRRSVVWRDTYENALRRGATAAQALRLANATAHAYKRQPDLPDIELAEPARLPGATGPLPALADYRGSEVWVAGRLSTMPALEHYHPAEALPYARAAIEALAEWGAQPRLAAERRAAEALEAADLDPSAEEQAEARRIEIRQQTLVELSPPAPPTPATPTPPPAPTPTPAPAPTPAPTPPPTASPAPTPTPTPTASPPPTAAEYLAEQARQDALEDARQAAEAAEQIADAPPEPQP